MPRAPVASVWACAPTANEDKTNSQENNANRHMIFPSMIGEKPHAVKADDRERCLEGRWAPPTPATANWRTLPSRRAAINILTRYLQVAVYPIELVELR